MDKNSISCPWGDCPGLNNGPKSSEHDGRFLQRRKAESRMVKSESTVMTNGVSTRNPAK